MRTASRSISGSGRPLAHQIVVAFAGADLVARKDAILELVVERTR